MDNYGSISLHGKHAKRLMENLKPGEKAKLSVSATVDHVSKRSQLPVGPGDVNDQEELHDMSFSIDDVHSAEPYNNDSEGADDPKPEEKE